MNTEEKDDAVTKGLGGVAAGAALIGGVNPLVTGRSRLYHGTTPELAEKIKLEGLKPSSMVNSPSVTQQALRGRGEVLDKAKNLAYLTNNPTEANMYAAQAAFLGKGGKLHQSVARADAMTKAQFNPFQKGVLRANVPLWKDEIASKLRPNPEAMGSFKEWDAQRSPFNFDTEIERRILHHQLAAAKAFEGGVDSKWFQGAKDYQPVSLKEIGEYAKAKPGRFAAGVGLSALGAAGVGYGAHKLYQHYKKEKNSAAFLYGTALAGKG